MNFLKKVSYAKKWKKGIKELKQLSDPPKRIVVEMVGGGDMPKGPSGPKGFRAQMTSRPEGPPGLRASSPRASSPRASRPEGLNGLEAVLPFKLAFCCFSSCFAILAHVLAF